MIDDKNKKESRPNSFLETLLQFLIDIPKILLGLFSLSVGIGGVMLFLYFISINYIPVFDLASILWIIAFIFGFGLIVVLGMGAIFALPGWSLGGFIDNIKGEGKEKWLDFLSFKDCKIEIKNLFYERAFWFFIVPWIINSIFLIIWAVSYYIVSTKWKNTNLFIIFIFIPLIVTPLVWKKIIPCDKGLEFRARNLIFLGASFWFSSFIIFVLAILLEQKLSSAIYVSIIYTFFAALATFSIGRVKDKWKILIPIITIIVFPIVSLIASNRLNLIVNTPIQVFNLGKVPVRIKVNSQYAENLNQLLASQQIGIHDNIITGTLLTRLGSEYVVEIPCEKCFLNGKSIVIPISKEKVDAIIFKKGQ